MRNFEPINLPNKLLYKNVLNIFDIDDIKDMNADQAHEYIQTIIHEQEIIYYHKAMEFLMYYDNSLQNSLALAYEMGYSANDLNSELLATLLHQQHLSDESYLLIEALQEHNFFSDDERIANA